MISSGGKIPRIKGKKTNRIHHLFSKNEKAVFNLFQWDDEVNHMLFHLLCTNKRDLANLCLRKINCDKKGMQ